MLNFHIEVFKDLLPIAIMEGNYFVLWKYAKTQANFIFIFMGSQENVIELDQWLFVYYDQICGSLWQERWLMTVLFRIFVGWHWFSHHSKNLGPFKFIHNILEKKITKKKYLYMQVVLIWLSSVELDHLFLSFF